MALRTYGLALLTLILAVFAAYANVYGNGFLLDDEFLLQKNRFISDADYFWRIFVSSSTMGAGGTDSFYRPMQTLAYFIVVQLFGLEVAAIHGLNVLLHAVNAGLVFFLLAGRLKIPALFAWAAAMIWAMHPLHTEAVTYMSATADPLHTLFVLAAVVSVPRMWLASVFFVCGLMSKESAIVTPALVMVVLAVQAKRPVLDWRSYIKTWPLWVITVAYLILRKTWLDFDDTFSFYQEPNVYTESMWYRTLTFLGTLPNYFRLLVWPSELHMERDFPVYAGWTAEPLLGVLMIGLGLAAVVFEWRRPARPLSFAFLWFFAAHVPHTGVLLPVNSLFLEHWMYLPSIGLWGGLLWVISGAPVFISAKRGNRGAGRDLYRWSVIAVTLLIAGALASVTFGQNRVWASPVTFYENILRHAKGNARVHNNLGMAYSERGMGDKAIEQYLLAVGYKDTYPQVRHNLAEEYMKRGDFQEAIAQLKRALEINPQFYYSYKNLAAIYQRLGDQKMADHYYNLYQQIRPE
jgi:hypothetical protein